jgi:Serine carboxypeptidase S28
MVTCRGIVSDFFFHFKRFLVNSEHFKPGGPIFMYVTDGFEVNPGYLSSGLVYDLAKDVGGFIFAAEPRFFGQSRPTK